MHVGCLSVENFKAENIFNLESDNSFPPSLTFLLSQTYGPE